MENLNLQSKLWIVRNYESKVSNRSSGSLTLHLIRSHFLLRQLAMLKIEILTFRASNYRQGNRQIISFFLWIYTEVDFKLYEYRRRKISKINIGPTIDQVYRIKHTIETRSCLVIDDTWSTMEFFGVTFAPLRVPLERRLQTVAAAAWFCVLAFGGLICLIFTAYLLIFTQWLRYFIILYLIWAYYDRDTSRRGGRSYVWIQIFLFLINM